MSSEHCADLLPDLVAGIMAPAQAAEVRVHLDACPACRGEFEAWRTVAGAARERASMAVPPSDLAARISASIVGRATPGPLFSRRLGWLLRFVWSQAPLVRREIWSAGAVVVAIGVGVSLLIGGSSEPGRALVLLAPLAAAIGVAMIYGSENDPSLELALATPVSPRLVVLARLVVVLAFDLALALAASLILAAFHGPGIAVSLVGQWLGPMLLLGSLSLVLSLVVGTTGSIAAGGALWVIRVFEQSDGGKAHVLGALAQVVDAVWQTSPLTFGLAAAAVAVALLLAPRVESPSSRQTA